MSRFTSFVSRHRGIVAGLTGAVVGLAVGAGSASEPTSATTTLAGRPAPGTAAPTPAPAPTTTVTRTINAPAPPAPPARTVVVPAPTPTPAPAPAPAADPAASDVDGFSFARVTTRDDGIGDFATTARVTNVSSDSETVVFTVTYFDGSGDVIGTGQGTATGFAIGSTKTVTFASTDAYDESVDRVEFQVEAGF